MKKVEKIIQKMLNKPREMRFEEVKKVLLYEGWALDKIKGSHHIFIKDDLTLVIPMHHGLVKGVYIKRAVIELELEEKYGKK